MSKTRRRVVGILAICLLVFAGGTGAQETAPATEANGEPLLSRSVGTFPRIGSYEVLRGDFHIHTPHSDGKVPPRERVLEAWRYDYDVIAITDHGNYNAYAEALPLARSLGMLLVRGMETGIAGKEHYVVLDITEDYQPRNPHRWAEQPDGEAVYYREQLRHVADSGGLALYAHPHVGFREPTEWGIAQGIIQGIEVKNAVVGSRWETIESHGTWCYPNAFDWALEHDLIIFANSDIHAPRRGDNEPVTLVLVEERSEQGVMDAIRARRTFATTGVKLCLWFFCDGHPMGSELQLSESPKFTVNVAVPPEEGQLHTLELVRDGEVIHCFGGEGQQSRYTFADEQPPQRDVSFYYLRVTLRDNNMAWSSPIWVKRA